MGLRKIREDAAGGPRLADVVGPPVWPHDRVLAAAAPRLCASPLFDEAVDALGCPARRLAAARVCFLAVRPDDVEHVDNRRRVAGADGIARLVALLRDDAAPDAALVDAALALRFTVMGRGPWIERATEVGAVELIYGLVRARAERDDAACAFAALSPLAALLEALVALAFAPANRGRVMNLEGAVHAGVIFF
jgi:hypothetical protein